MLSAEFVKEHAKQTCHNCSTDNDDCKRNDKVVAKFKCILHKVDKICEECLL